MDDYGQEEFNKEGKNTRAVTVAIHVVPSVAHFTVPSWWEIYQRFASPSKHTITGSMYSASQENESWIVKNDLLDPAALSTVRRGFDFLEMISDISMHHCAI